MDVLNIHNRVISEPREKVGELLNALGTKNDVIWPNKQWPAIRLNNGVSVGSKGGHGIIGYSIIEFIENDRIVFQFNKPKGFHGTHSFTISSLDQGRTKIEHKIQMKIYGITILYWSLVIRWLHDALIEDAFDNYENYFSGTSKRTPWSNWVKLWRWILKSTRKH